ncbi:hypothetical protein [Lysinibacillus zambalensis]
MAFRLSNSSFRHFDDSIRRSGDSIRRSNSYFRHFIDSIHRQ